MTDRTWVGRPLPRKEDDRLLRGDGHYLADRPVDRGTWFVHFVRSTRAHARIRDVDLGAALAVPTVAAGFTGADLHEEVPALLIDSLRPQLAGELRVPPSPLLAHEKVVFHGEPLAVLLGTDPARLADAAAQVRVEYDPLPHVLDPEAALAPDAPVLHEGWPDNVMYRERIGDATEAFAGAPVTVSERYVVPRTGASPLEPRGLVAEWDDSAGLTVHVGTQRPHILRLALAELLGVPHHRVRVVAPLDQGGAFGTKAPVQREQVVICLLARRLRRTLRWVESREDGFRAGIGQERGQVVHLELAARDDGTLLGMRCRLVADTGDGNQGVYLGFVMPFLGALYLPGPYHVPVVQIDLLCPVTNKPVLNPSRAFGQLPVRFAVDSALDLLARRVGVDPVELRRRNLVRAFPHSTATGLSYDSGDFVAGFDRLVAEVGLPEFRARQAALREQGRHVGVGFAGGTEMSGISSALFVALENQPGFGAATVTVDPHGTVHVTHGDAPQGQGHETTMAQVVADELGITPDDITVRYGDTSSSPFGSGTLGGRFASYTVSAAVLACREIRAKAARVAAHDLGVEAGPDEFDFRGGAIVWRHDPARSISLAAVARHLLMAPVNLPEGVEPGLHHTSYYEPDVIAMHSAGFHAAVVEVEPDTGQFTVLRYLVAEDCGRRINPLIIDGQVQGGAVLGLANSMFEEFVYDADGVLLSTTLQDYLMPSAADVPDIESYDVSVPTPHTPLGTRGKGEGVPGPVPAALANAIADALAPAPVALTTLPIRPEHVWRALAAPRTAPGDVPGALTTRG